jgi:hypothetical protein
MFAKWLDLTYPSFTKNSQLKGVACSMMLPSRLMFAIRPAAGPNKTVLAYASPASPYICISSRPAITGRRLARSSNPPAPILKSRYESDYHHPRDLATLKRDLLEAGIDFDAMRDPWGEPYRAVFETAGRFERLALVSGGPDRKFGTDDDLTATVIERAHFQAFHDRIEAALRALPAFPYSEASTVAALRAADVKIASTLQPRR